MNQAIKSNSSWQGWKIPTALALLGAAGLSSYLFITRNPFDEPGDFIRLSNGSRMRLVSVLVDEPNVAGGGVGVQIQYEVSEFPDPEALITTTSNQPPEVHEAINLALGQHKDLHATSGTLTFSRENAFGGKAYVVYKFTTGDHGSWKIVKSKSGELWP